MRCPSYRRYGQALARNLGLHPVTLEPMAEYTPPPEPMLVIVPNSTTDEELRALYVELKAKTGLDTFLVKRRPDTPEERLARGIPDPDPIIFNAGEDITTWFGHKALPPTAKVRVKCKYQRRVLGLDGPG